MTRSKRNSDEKFFSPSQTLNAGLYPLSLSLSLSLCVPVLLEKF